MINLIIFIIKKMISENTQQVPVKETKVKAKTFRKYFVDFAEVIKSNLVTLEAAIKYLNENIKFNNLKTHKDKPSFIKVSAGGKGDKKNTLCVEIENSVKTSKRYIKYLIKRFLKKENILSFMRVISTSTNTYSVKLMKKSE
jgi:large subunit ribosomal protein L22e